MIINWVPVGDYSGDKQLAELHLSQALSAGQLSIFLGAGVSMPLGLPSWGELLIGVIEQMSAENRSLLQLRDRLHPSTTFAEYKNIAQILRDACSDEEQFIAILKRSLYSKLPNKNDLQPTPLLFALGAMLMNSRRGHVRDLWTLNYDDLFEWYLSTHGFITQTIMEVHGLLGEADVNIFHPHGFIPHNPLEATSKEVILTADSYAKRSLARDQPWRELVQHALKTKVFLCIGISWTDELLKDLILEAKSANEGRPTAFWCCGPKFDPNTITEYTSARVAPLQFSDYSEIPKFLLSICQRAAKRMG